MYAAAGRESPVIMRTETPAAAKSATVDAASGFTGSAKASSPSRVSPRSSSGPTSSTPGMGFDATASTRMPFPASPSTTAATPARASAMAASIAFSRPCCRVAFSAAVRSSDGDGEPSTASAASRWIEP